jgi:1,4-dihydroxy-2-naphthoate polyprenyltransferase
MMFKSWLLAFRLKTLTAALVPIVTAAALAHLQGWPVAWNYFSFLLVAAFSIQIATNLFNDVIDFEKGADNNRLGPLRVTQSGHFSARTVYLAAGLFCLIAFIFGIPLVVRGGLPIVAIGLVSLFLAYGYTGGPFPLAYRGVGDLFVVIFFGLLAVGGSFYILTGKWSMDAFVLGLQVGFLSTVLIAMNNLRDSETDALVGKKTLAVRFGDNFVRGEILSLIAISYGLLFYWVFRTQQWLFLLPLVSLPVAIKIFKILRQKKEALNLIKGLGMSALLHVLFGLTFSLACIFADKV